MSGAVDPRRGGAATVTVRVRYPETDRMGVAYHAHYLVWFEIGRTELLRDTGRAYREIEDADGLQFPVIAAAARYLAPARYDDLLSVRARVAEVSGARVRFEYDIARDADARLLATGFTDHAVVGRDGRPRRLPDDLRRRLARRAEGA